MLLTTETEFDELRAALSSKSPHHVRVSYVAACGHENAVVVTNFLLRQTGLRCKDCVKHDVIDILKKRESCHELEYRGYNELRSILSKTFNVQKTNEGCLADMIIRKPDIAADEWLGIQLKVTQKKSKHGCYSYSLHNNSYNGLMIMCYSIDEKNVWVIPYADISSLKTKLNISDKSKYSKYKVLPSELNEHILQKYDDYVKNSCSSYMKPISTTQQQEREYAAKREKCISFLQYSYPEVEGGKTDFYVGKVKVQEKVSCINENKHHICMYVNNGKKSCRAYMKGENDIYWIHIKSTSYFMAIPDDVMHRHKLVADVDVTSKKVVVCTRFPVPKTGKYAWMMDYVFSYEKPDRDRLCKLFANL